MSDDNNKQQPVNNPTPSEPADAQAAVAGAPAEAVGRMPEGIPDTARALEEAAEFADALVSELELDELEPVRPARREVRAAAEADGEDASAEVVAGETAAEEAACGTCECMGEMAAEAVTDAPGGEAEPAVAGEGVDEYAAETEVPFEDRTPLEVAVLEEAAAELRRRTELAGTDGQAGWAAPGEEVELPEAVAEPGMPRELRIPVGATLQGLVESLILVSANPISAAKVASTLVAEGVTAAQVREAVEQLNVQYTGDDRSYRIQEIAGGYQFYTLPVYAEVVGRLVKAKDEVRLSQAALEVLAIVAYKQPIIRADIEAIRGVACGPMLRHLLDVNLVKVDGKSDLLGRPLMYGTTKRFLQHFGLNSLKDLPKAPGLSRLG